VICSVAINSFILLQNYKLSKIKSHTAKEQNEKSSNHLKHNNLIFRPSSFLVWRKNIKFNEISNGIFAWREIYFSRGEL